MSSNRWYTSGAGCSSAISTVPCMHTTPDPAGMRQGCACVIVPSSLLEEPLTDRAEATKQVLRSTQACGRLVVRLHAIALPAWLSQHCVCTSQ